MYFLCNRTSFLFLSLNKRIFIYFFVLSFFTHQAIAKNIKIPFRYVQSFILLEVKLENVIPLKLIFDTGAEHNLLFDRSNTDLIQNAYVKELKVLGSDLLMEIPALLTSNMNVRLHESLSTDIQFLALVNPSQSMNEVIGEKVDGILSASIFNNYFFEINYKKRYILVTDQLPLSKKLKEYKSCNIKIYKNKPFIQSEIQINHNTSKITLNLLLDTGAGLTLLIYKDAQSQLSVPDHFIPGVLGSGIGGILSGFLAKSERCSFCEFNFQNIHTYYQEINSEFAKKESQFKQGLIGNQVLERFKLLFDYRNEKLYVKEVDTKSSFQFDRSGMSILAGGKEFNQFVVAYVIPYSPADAVGIKADDMILSINRIPSRLTSLGFIQRKLSSKKDKIVRLKLKNGKEVRIVKVKLRDLL